MKGVTRSRPCEGERAAGPARVAAATSRVPQSTQTFGRSTGRTQMKAHAVRMRSVGILGGLAVALAMALTPVATAARSSGGGASTPTWWAKYERLLHHPAAPLTSTATLSVGPDVDVSNETGPQSETAIAIDPSNPQVVVAGSNEIDRLPMRGYFSANGGSSWGGVDLPLPPASSTNGTDFGSDPGVAFDTRGNVYYVYIVVFFNRFFASIQGTEMAVAKSVDGGATWPQVTYFNFNSGSGKFNDKPMIAVDTNPASPHRDSVYVGWDNASLFNGKSSANNSLVFSRSTDGGASFSAPISVSTNNGGPRAVIGADPFVGPNGEVYM